MLSADMPTPFGKDSEDLVRSARSGAVKRCSWGSTRVTRRYEGRRKMVTTHDMDTIWIVLTAEWVANEWTIKHAVVMQEA